MKVFISGECFELKLSLHSSQVMTSHWNVSEINETITKNGLLYFSFLAGEGAFHWAVEHGFSSCHDKDLITGDFPSCLSNLETFAFVIKCIWSGYITAVCWSMFIPHHNKSWTSVTWCNHMEVACNSSVSLDSYVLVMEWLLWLSEDNNGIC